MNVKYVWIGMIVALLVGAVVVFLRQLPPDEAVSGTPVQFSGHGISLTFPAGWQVQTNPQRYIYGNAMGDIVLVASNLVPAQQFHQQPEEAIVAVYEMNNLDHDNTTDELYKRHVYIQNPSRNGSTEDHNIQQKEAQVGGGAKVKWVEWSTGGRSTINAYVMSPSGVAYGFDFASDENRMARHRKIYEDILRSIRFDTSN